jgi:RNA polymerase sigma-70 factor, ECF subfamily
VEATTKPFPAPVRGRADQGAAAAFLAELFDRHARSVLAICRGLLRDHAEAEDAAQQTFFSAYRSLLSGAGPRDPAAWLATIARNECRTRIRERMRAPLGLPEPPVEESDPAVETIRRADVRSLRLALAELPTNQQRAFMLREFGGLSYDELAAALGVSAGAAESLLFRARRRLRGSLRSALAGVNGLVSAPFALRDLIGRIVQAGSAPVAIKVAAATGGAALVTTGAVAVAPHHHRLAVLQRQAHVARHAVARPVSKGRAIVSTAAPVRSAVEPERHRGGGGSGFEHRGRVAEPREPVEPVEAEHAAPVAEEPRPVQEPEHKTVAPSAEGPGGTGETSLERSGSGDTPELRESGGSGDSGSGDSGSGGS